MPRYAHSQLRWSGQTQEYVLSTGDHAGKQAFSSEWLEQIASFSFHSRWGMSYTARKQRVQRGSSYWYAYRRLHGRLIKRYLGKTADLTLARLEEVAHLLESASISPQPPSRPDQELAAPQPAPPAPYMEETSPPSPSPAPLLLVSKLSPPRLHNDLLDRPRLFALLDAARESPLTLLSAPAGFGKTTLVCQWMAARRARPDFPPIAWVSLEPSDNDPVRFWRYLIAACQTFQIDLTQVHSALISTTPQPPFLPSSLENVLTTLLNALAQSPSAGILVLEDYHIIASPQIHETLAFFLDHLPANIHLIIITRSDPPFPLARLRARNELYEVRTADLRFSQDETATLLQQSLPSPLRAETIQRLHAQLEGWGAGLHLIKLALQRTSTSAGDEQWLPLPTQTLASFQEYFTSEVLDRQSESVQQFLLQTSSLTRLSASLCDAMTEQRDSHDMLALLERTNLFLEPLDATGQWYRYHALFSEAMRNEARRRLGEDHMRCLSTRASRWYEAHGDLGASIDAALAAHDYARAATLIERATEDPALPDETPTPHTVQRWLEQLPETILEQHPILSLSYAATLLLLSASWLPTATTTRSLEKLLRSAEHHFRMENQSSKLAELFAFRSLLALRQGDRQASITYAKQALDWFTQTHIPAHGAQQIWRGLSLAIVADEWMEVGCFPQARAALLEAYALCEAAENQYFRRVAMTKLAQVFFEQGDFQQAITLSRQVLPEAREAQHVFVLCNALSTLAALYYERNELDLAYQHAHEALTASQANHMVYYEVRAALILARVQQAQGQIVVAQQQLTALLDKIPVSLPHLSQQLQTALARLALSTGDHLTMQRWATARSPHPDFSQQIEEELLLARWLQAQGKLEEASHQLEHALIATQQAGHTRLVREVQVELVLVSAASKRKTQAHQMLRDVLVEALDANAIRLFLDAGEHMAILLRTLLPQERDQPLLAYIRILLSAFPVSRQDGAPDQPTSLLEPLSPQEMRVLRLLVQHRSNADIASELVVSINTVRTQVQSIYNKLGVHTRGAASDVARELRLIS